MAREYDLVVIGSGPAGMTASIYGARANMKTLLIDRLSPGGKIINSEGIGNFPGHGTINGAELGFKIYEDTQAAGAEFDYLTVTDLVKEDHHFIIQTEESEEEIISKAIVVATGTKNKELNVPGEDELSGSFIHTCAVCDGAQYEGKTVALLGGGNTAVNEGIYLAGLAEEVTVLLDDQGFTAKPDAVEQLTAFDNVTIIEDVKINSFEQTSDNKLDTVNYTDVDGNEKSVEVDGAFAYLGSVPATEFLKDFDVTVDTGYVVTNPDMETDVKGLYAAGDVRDKQLRQVITGCAEGATAAQNASDYLKELARA